MVALRFNTQGVAPNTAPQAIPSGTYDVTITATEEKPTSKGDGSYVQFEFTITSPDPTLNGRKVYDRLNTNNPSTQAMEIAFGTLSAICHVCGRHDIQDTQQLHGIPLKVVIAKMPRGDTPKNTPADAVQYTNEVKGYKDQYGNDPGQAGQSAGQQQGGGATPQWAGGQNNNNGGQQGNNGGNNQGNGQVANGAGMNNQGGNPNNGGQNWQGGGQQNNNGAGQQGGGQNNNGGAPSWTNQGNGQNGGGNGGQQQGGDQGQNNQNNQNNGGGNNQGNNGGGNQGGPNPNEPPPWARAGQQGGN